MLGMYQRVIFGPLKNEENTKLVDLSRREVAIFVPLLVMMLFMGLYPRPLLVRMEKSVEATLKRVNVLRQAQHERLPDDEKTIRVDKPSPFQRGKNKLIAER